MTRSSNRNSFYDWVCSREICSRALPAKLKCQIWQKFRNCQNKIDNNGFMNYEGIFGLKYTFDGKILGAACEKNAVVFLDPLSGKVIRKREKVHRTRCNTINFLDARIFATCSDDHTVGLWDLRNLKQSVMMLSGHTNWVKNVEFHKPSGLLVSSAFDGTVCVWDINKPKCDYSCVSQQLLKLPDILRMRLSPKGDSMYLTFMNTYKCIAIHNFNIEKLLKTKKINIPDPSKNNKLIGKDVKDFGSNHCEHYCMSGFDEGEIACPSIFVHPRNQAIVVRNENYTERNTETTVLNTTLVSTPDYGGKPPTPLNQRNVLPRGFRTNSVQTQSRSLDYIQEVCFSPCGRLIASPLGFGIQILSFDENISHYTDYIESLMNEPYFPPNKKLRTSLTDNTNNNLFKTKPFHEVTCSFGHTDTVLSTAFSPTQYQLATGSTSGQIIFHEPKL